MSEPTQFLRHAWTHRSDFQKTKGYGKMNLDDCTVTGARTIVADSDDELSDSQRAVKRRRIEKLAEGYLRGEPLFISSARSCPQALMSTVVRHKKSSNEPRFVLPRVDSSKDSSQIWTEAEDDDEILRRLLRSSKVRQKRTEVGGTRSAPVEAEPVEDVKAQASCKPRRRLRPTNISSGPSEEALKQAAALRNRKGRATGTDMVAVTEEPGNVATPMVDPSDCITVTQSERVLRSLYDEREWLSRRKSRFSFGGEDVHDGTEAHSSPCIEPSSPPSDSPRRRATSTESYGQGASSSPRHDVQPPAKTSYHTAPEHMDVFEEPVEVSYLDRPLNSPPPPAGLATPTQASGRTAGLDNSTSSNQKGRGTNDEDRRQHLRDLQYTANSRQSSPNWPAGNVGSQLTLAGRSRAVPEVFKPTYLKAPSTQNGTTPLMYRKRTTISKASTQLQESAAAPATRRSSRRRVTFPSSEVVQLSGPRNADQQHVASHPPVLDLSFEPDCSFAPKLNMALVEQHTHTLLPVEPKSDGRATSVMKASRRELRDIDVETSRCDNEPPPSSQVVAGLQPVPRDSSAMASMSGGGVPNLSKMSNSERRQTWLGTQAMVAQAERELFTSPEKQRNTFTPINEQTPATVRDRSMENTPLLQEREPSKQLSQEPAPSTQAMLETFAGFSTVKKPRGVSVLKHTAEPSPFTAEKGKRPETRVLSEAGRPSLGTSTISDNAKGNRGSSLRFSISSLESPVAGRLIDEGQEPAEASAAPGASTTTSLATPEPSSSARASRRSARKSSNRKPAEEQYSQRKSSQAGGTFSHAMLISEDFPTLRHSNLQAAQGLEAPAGILRDPSNLSQTIDDLTNVVLGMKDLEGLLSQ